MPAPAQARSGPVTVSRTRMFSTAWRTYPGLLACEASPRTVAGKTTGECQKSKNAEHNPPGLWLVGPERARVHSWMQKTHKCGRLMVLGRRRRLQNAKRPPHGAGARS